MRINPIGINYQVNKQRTKVPTSLECKHVAFQGKHSNAKFLSGLFGTIATASAAVFAIATSGGLAAIPFVIGYGTIGVGAGAAIGHTLDKGNKELDNLTKEEKNGNKLHIQA